LSLGEGHALAVTADGDVVSWGAGTAGQVGCGSLGDADGDIINDFRKMAKGGRRYLRVKTKLVSAGGWHSLALDEDGTVWSWGGDGGPAIGLGEYQKGFRRSLVPPELFVEAEKRASDEGEKPALDDDEKKKEEEKEKELSEEGALEEKTTDTAAERKNVFELEEYPWVLPQRVSGLPKDVVRVRFPHLIIAHTKSSCR
jgi:alpha-tubulin suppressor-like RCC1 family protein